MSQEVDPFSSKAVQVALRLSRAGKSDTAYRDLYLWRARAVFSSVLPQAEYLRMKQNKVLVGNWLRESRSALERKDWLRVKELAGRIRSLRESNREREFLLALGTELYGPTP